MLMLCVLVGCVKSGAGASGGVTPYSESFRAEPGGGRRHLVKIRTSDDTEDSVVKEYLYRRANELCPSGWDTDQDFDDLEVIGDGNDAKGITMDISCKP